jgi:hypothetical protein
MKKLDWMEIFTVVLIVLWVVLWLLFMALLSGCANSIDTPIYDSHPPVKKIVIEYPPQRIVYFGAVTKEGEQFAKNCLREMQKRKFHDYKFNETTTLNSNVQVGTNNTDSESASVIPINQQ